MAAPTKAQTALLVIDVQIGIPEGAGGAPSSKPEADDNIAKLLEQFRSNAMTVIHVQHLAKDTDSPLHPSKKSVQFAPFALPKGGEPIFTKRTSSAFASSALEEGLKLQDVKRVLVVGKETNACVSSTIRAASDMGVMGDKGEIVLIDDATACYGVQGVDAATVHKAHVATLGEGKFCRITNTKDVLAEISGYA